jgi:hypothetical protein
MNLDPQANRIFGTLEEDRRQILDEAYRYARYTRNQTSLLLLSKISGWVAATFEDPLPEGMKTRTGELLELLGSLMEEPSVASAPAQDPSNGCNTDGNSL